MVWMTWQLGCEALVTSHLQSGGREMNVGDQLVFSLLFILTWTLTMEWHLPPSLT